MGANSAGTRVPGICVQNPGALKNTKVKPRVGSRVERGSCWGPAEGEDETMKLEAQDLRGSSGPSQLFGKLMR